MVWMRKLKFPRSSCVPGERALEGRSCQAMILEYKSKVRIISEFEGKNNAFRQLVGIVYMEYYLKRNANFI